MKAIRNLVLITLLGGAQALQAATTYTDGTASFTVNLISIAGNYDPRVDAYWVTDASGAFVMTARYDAGSRRQYLYQWAAARGSWPYNAPIDGYSGATISTWGTFTVYWDCRNTNNVLMPDGEYRFWIEMTDKNGQGPYTTNGIPFYKGTTNVNRTYPNQQYIQNLSVTYTPIITHDIAVTSLSPSFGRTNALVPVTVSVTNKTSSPESFTITVSNATVGTLIGSQPVNHLAGNAVSNVTFNWNTAGLGLGAYALVGRASAVPGETVLTDNVRTNTVTLRADTRDVGVAAIAVPAQVQPGTLTNVTVTVTNRGDAAESFAVVLTDDTDARSLGTNQINSLAAQASTTTTFLWNTAGATVGAHALRAVAAAVSGETATADNTLTRVTTVVPSFSTNQSQMFIARNSLWRYNDGGTNLGTAWRDPDYSDASWPQGLGPLGYGDGPLNTVISYGPSSDNKFLTYYFRTPFTITNLPDVLTLRLRRDDGAVVYHNGVELYRVNMPTNNIKHSTRASSALSGASETTYFETNLPAANCVMGANLMAVEIHQWSRESSDVYFDLELLGTVIPFIPSHDVAVRAVSAPAQALPGTRTNITVTVTNRGNYSESFAVTLTDDTDGVPVGTQNVADLSTNASASVVFPWDVPNVPFVTHTMRVVAGPAMSEVNTADNTNTFTVLVSPVMETNVLIARNSSWRFNDTGTDLTWTPWKQLDYPDAAWGTGPGPLGYGDAVATTNSFGPQSTNKYPAYYYRRAFNIDVLPTTMRLRLRRDDGAVVYHNGVEIFRANITNNPVTYKAWASATVDGANETTYFESEVPVTNAVVGANVLAVEVHQVNRTSSDISFDLELLGINPLTPRTHEVAAIEVAPQADALIGDLMRVAVTVANRGNASETFNVYLRDTGNNQIVASAVVSGLAAGGSTTVLFDWPTTGTEPGTHSLQAFTVLGGVTNLAGAVTAPASLTGTGFGLLPAPATGSIGGRCTAAAMLNNLLVVGAGATLEVWDRSNPAAPVKLGAVRLPGLIESIVASGTYAYVACGSAGVQFVDLATPSSPVHRNTFNTSGHAYGIAVSGDFLYVADGVSGLRIVNITSPALPLLAGAYYTPGPARAVAVAGTTAYVLDAHSGLMILNVANPAAPALLGAYTAIDAGQALAVSGNQAYVADANNRFYVIDVANPGAPALLNAANTLLLANLVPQALVLNGSTAYVPVGESGLAILDISSPASPAFVISLATPGQALAGALVGTTLYLANGFHGFQAYHVGTATAPALLADMPTGIRASDVVVNNNLAYVAAGESGFRIYSVTNPSAPTWIGWSVDAQNAQCVALSGTTAYVGDGQHGLKILNVANPASPTLLGSWNGAELSYIRNVGASGSLVIASDGRQIALIDASAPASPALRATYSTPAFVFDLTVAGACAYLACGNAGFVILDLSASALTQRSVTDTPGLASGISVSGTTAYVADGADGWRVYDVSNPSAPVLSQSQSQQGPAYAVAISGVLAALGNGANSAVTLDVSNPLTPVTKQAFAGLVRSLRLAANGGLAYVSEDEAGLAILGSTDDSDGDGLPDAWEQEIVDANPNDNLRTLADVNPGDDFDHDGVSNQHEYLAGTSASNPASRFMMVVEPASGGGTGVTVSWASVAGKIYTVHKSTNLAAGFTVLQDEVPATPPLNRFTDPTPGGTVFYIISVR